MKRQIYSCGLKQVGRLFCSLLGMVIFLGVMVCKGQQVEASLYGYIKDQANAAVPDAQITVTNQATGVTVLARSGPDGSYNVTALRPGTYTLTVQQTGFEKTTQTGIQLDVNQKALIDVQLTVGSLTTTVEVAGIAPQVETATATVSVTIETSTVTELPLNIRRFGALGLLMPGTVPDRGGFSTNVFGSPFSEVTYASNGARGSGNNVLIDGVDSQNMFTGGFSVQPSPDAIQEFKFQTESFSAAFGKRAGSTLNLITKSGTNAVHGSAFEFLRNDVLDARNFFNVNQTNPVTGAEIPGSARPEYRRNQFGGYIGGPIIKNKMFVFGGYEALRERKGLTYLDQVPTAKMLQGDFSELLDPNNPFGVTPIVDPLTCSQPPAGCTPFPGNVIPPKSLDPVALKAISYNPFPAPNAPGLVNNYIATPVRRRGDNQYMAKWDYNISDKDKVFVRFIRATSTTFTTEQAYSSLPGFGDKIPYYGTNVALGWTHTFSPTLLNEVRIGFSRNQDIGVCEHCPRPAGFMAGFGIQGFTSNGQATTFRALSPSQEGFPIFEFGNSYTTIGDSNYRPVESNDMVEKYYDALTLIRGKHTMTIGADLDPYQSFRDQAPVSPHGQFYFDNRYSNFGISDFLLGDLSNAGSSIRDAVNEHTGGFYAAFFQDDIRATHNLTINVGVRWEHHQMPVDRGNVGAVLFRIPGAGVQKPGNAMLVLPGYQTADSFCNDPLYTNAQGQRLVMCSSDMKKYGFTGRTARSLWFGDNFNWGPRIGFAWRPTSSDKFVVRAGYGMFFDFPDFNIFHYGFNNPVQGATYLQGFNSNVTPTHFTGSVFATAGAVTLAESFISVNADPHFRQSYIHEWDFDIESQLTPSLALDTRYLGTAAIELTHFHCYGNQPIPGPGDIQPRRPFPDFGNTCEGGPGANANYNSLQVQLTKRMSQGLSFIAGYTWAHQLSTNEGEEGGYADGGAGLGQDDLHPGAEYGNGTNDVRHRFTFGGIYDLPFGKGQTFGAGAGRLVDTLIGGWEFAPDLSLQTGFYWTPAAGQDIANVVFGSFRPDRTCNGNLPKGKRTVAQYYDITCFTDNILLAGQANGVYRFGNAGRGILDGPGIFNLDFGMYKDFKLSERFKMQFRSEFFNAFNRANFNGLSTSITSGSTGQITGAADGREIQFALKLTF
ncbi:MAG TPA: carboxypeptidase-like regulatory domain-containing protein [Terriglobia bacterium]|nr:carboxypeptidase-like regulatory domain-containing protein [Terriglobia bacterium]